MYEWVEALAYELEAAGRPAAASQREKMADSYVRGMARLGGTKAGESLGEWVRSFGAVVSQVPVLSWQADLVAARQGTDHLMRQVKLLPADDPQAGIAAIQVVEALDAVRRERLAIRAAMLLVNPVGTTAAVALNTAGQLGKADLARPRLLRRGHAIAARNHGADAQFSDVHALARAYLAGGKPKHALRFAVDAAQVARRAANAAPTAQVGRSSVLTQLRGGAGEGVVGAVGAARQAAREALAPTYSQFAPAEQWRRRCGAALVTASWAHLAMNQRDRASEAAAAAVRLGNTMGYVPQAAALPATGSSARQRLELLRKVDGCDRREYSGTARGDGGTAWNLTSLQTKKAVKLGTRRSRSPQVAGAAKEPSPPRGASIGVDDLIKLIEADDPGALVAYLRACPPSEHRERTLELVRKPHPEFRMMGLNLLALGYSKTPAVATALTIVDAVGTVGRNAFENTAEAPFLDVVASAAAIAAASRATLGRSDDLIAGAEAALDWLERNGSTEKSCELHLCLGEAELARGALAPAEQHLQAAESLSVSEADFGTRDRRKNLRRSYDKLAKQRATELQSAPAGPSAQDVERVADQLDTVSRSLPPEAAAEAAVIDALRSGLDDLAKDPLGSNESPVEQLADLLGASRQPTSQLGLQKRIREVGRILGDRVQGRDEALLRHWIPELQEMASAAEQQGLGNDLMTIRWCLQVCHRRCDEHDQAAAVLYLLWESLEELRAGIDDPLERAGVLSQFPHLFPSLAETLYLSERPTELLEVIEGAKGRVLADVLDRNRSELANAPRGRGSLAALPAALERAAAHYLTYLVDDDCVYAVLVAADQSIHAARIDLDRATLRTYGALVDPSKWGVRRAGLLGTSKPSDFVERMSPLVAWLEPFVASGVIGEHDHLCYSPDDDLHLIPLHLLRVGGEQLLDRVSLSRVHSAWAVLDFLSAPASRPRTAIVIEVPAAGDPEEMAAHFSSIGDRLLELRPGERHSGVDATLGLVQTLGLAGRVVHFTTHGTFPTPDNLALDPNPFRSSGLLLAADGALPAKDLAVVGKFAHGLLSPERLGTLDFQGSHVTMQACSSGLSREGVGGDALGLEWALLLAGASSVLTAHWEVPLSTSSEFCRRFYEAWIMNGQTRAGAWRSTARGMARDGLSLSDWAGLALAGDWR